MSSTKYLVAYYERMKYNNGLNEDIDMNNNSPQLSYKTPQEQAIHASIVAGPNNNTRRNHVIIKYPTSSSSYVPIKHPTSDSPHVDDLVINIQLPYDPNAPIEPKLWDGNFHPISLHRSIEYLVSDSKNIKDSLNFIAKYITNKQVNPAKSNNLEDFNGIGKAIWNFISSVYQSKWNLLIADKNSNTLRQKISAKFTLKVPLASNRNNKSIDKLIPVSIEKIPLLSLLNCQRRLIKSPNILKISNQPTS